MALQSGQVPSASLWATVPHYISSGGCPPATLAILQRLQTILGTSFSFEGLEGAAERFLEQLDATITADPELRGYVQALDEEAADEDDATAAPELPEPTELVGDIEEFLRGRREDS